MPITAHSHTRSHLNNSITIPLTLFSSSSVIFVSLGRQMPRLKMSSAMLSQWLTRATGGFSVSSWLRARLVLMLVFVPDIVLVIPLAGVRWPSAELLPVLYAALLAPALVPMLAPVPTPAPSAELLPMFISLLQLSMCE